MPYLARLGISHVYASPIHTARPGSTHGYDIVDHARINPELGGEEGFAASPMRCEAHGLGLILDIVPNHMGVGGADNALVALGARMGRAVAASRAPSTSIGSGSAPTASSSCRSSATATARPSRRATSSSPSTPTRAASASGTGSTASRSARSPIPIVLDRALAALGEVDERRARRGARRRASACASWTRRRAPERRAGFPDEARGAEAAARRGGRGLARARSSAIERAVALVNGAPGIPESFGTLHRILEAQSYRLAHWRVAASDINYRRFFDINGLAGLRVEDPDIFAAHATRLVFRLVREGRIQGLRIDHIDGLADPEGYARALQAAVGPGFYVVVEKILEPGETLRPWPIAGTTGYDVLNLHRRRVRRRASRGRASSASTASATGIEGRYGALLREAKAEILEMSFASELEVLVSDLKRIADADRRTRDYTVYAMRRALVEIIARFPGLPQLSRRRRARRPRTGALIEETIERGEALRARCPTAPCTISSPTLCSAASRPTGRAGPSPELVRRFRRRFQQLTGPVMAKSLEDTLFYRYVRLLSLNEVGGDPGHFGVTPEEFHGATSERARDVAARA